MTSPADIAKLLQDALDTQPTIIGQPNDDSLLALKEELLDVLQTISYNGAGVFHHVIGVRQTESAYMTDHNSIAFSIPKRLGLWDDNIPKDATVVEMRPKQSTKLALKTTKFIRWLRTAARSSSTLQWRKCASTNSKMAPRSSTGSLRVTSLNTWRKTLLVSMLSTLSCCA
jgi:hypothetical protein